MNCPATCKWLSESGGCLRCIAFLLGGLRFKPLFKTGNHRRLYAQHFPPLPALMLSLPRFAFRLLGFYDRDGSLGLWRCVSRIRFDLMRERIRQTA